MNEIITYYTKEYDLKELVYDFFDVFNVKIQSLKRGNIKEKYYVIDNMKTANYILYYDNLNNIIKIQCSYNNNKLNGLYLEYYENSELRCKCSYNNNKLHGKYESYYSDGSIMLFCSYINGELDGEYTLYSHNYKISYLSIKCKYVMGKLHGKYIEYIDNCNKILKNINYIYGKKDGLCELYEYDTDKTYDYHYNNNNNTRLHVTENINYVLKSYEKSYYKDDKLNGMYELYNVINRYLFDMLSKKTHIQLAIKTNYLNGLLHGSYVTFYDNSDQVKEISFYSNDMLNGIKTYYHANGQLFYKAQYIDNVSTSLLEQYDSKGRSLILEAGDQIVWKGCKIFVKNSKLKSCLLNVCNDDYDIYNGIVKLKIPINAQRTNCIIGSTGLRIESAEVLEITDLNNNKFNNAISFDPPLINDNDLTYNVTQYSVGNTIYSEQIYFDQNRDKIISHGINVHKYKDECLNWLYSGNNMVSFLYELSKNQ
jgi:antitoxin component YwqK of YwqJK toxin-antitoxin module